MVHHKAQNVSARPRTRDIQIDEDTDFKSMFLPPAILEGLKKSGYIKPSPIQKKALPLVRCGLDLIVQAKAGTGKTCVFTVAILELVKPRQPHLQAIVLAPTREIAIQITSVINAIGQCVQGLKVGCFIGGYPLSVDVEKVKGCHVAVAAPGRLKHLLEKGLLNPRHVRLFVLDEADKLLEKVFVKDINAIYEQLPDSKQVLACSATYTDELVEFLSNYMNSGQYVSPYQTVTPTVLLGVSQFVSVIPRHVDRLAQLKIKEKHLLQLLRSISFNQCLVFSNLHTRAVSLCNLLRTEGWGVEWIAGRQKQQDRVAALTQLRDQRVRVLVTTDLTARGIDVENVNLVINLDLPMDHHTYLHRMGRAGRYGSHGIVITVVSNGQELTAFQKLIGMIGGSEQSVNLLPQNLKNKDLWTMTDENFQKICGVTERKASTSSAAEKGGDTTSTGEKYSPDSSDSEDYDKDFEGGKDVPESGCSEDIKNIRRFKEYKEEEQSNGADVAFGKLSGENLESQDIKVEQNFEKIQFNSAETSEITSGQAENGTSTDERFSRENSDCEEPADSCVCSLYEADSSDIKVITGPSLFALKKEDHWREVLPVIVNEWKVPLNTPIALIDSKLIRVRFWDKSKRCNKKMEDHSSKELINFVTTSDDKDFLRFNDIVFFLENGIEIDDTNKCIQDNTGREFLSFQHIEEALESGFCEVDSKSDEIEKVLMKYKAIKEKSESALISFDSFDLVGWLAVDELNNIIDEINIDKCEVFLFNLVTCLAGKNHIEVLSPSKGSSKETHDYIDNITTLNIQRFSLLLDVSLSNIAEKLTNSAYQSSNKRITRSKTEPSNKQVNNTLYNGMPIELCVSHKSHSDMKHSGINSLKVPNVQSNPEMCNIKKDKMCNLVRTSKFKNTGTEDACKRSQANKKKHNERKVLPENKENKYQGNKCTIKSLLPALIDKQHNYTSSNNESSNDSGSYVDMTWNPAKNKYSKETQKFQCRITDKKQLSKSPSIKMFSNQDLLCGKPQVTNKSEERPLNGFGQSHKHRNSDDSYDSYDTVEYETTDLDKDMYHLVSTETGTQRKNHNKCQDFTDKLPNPKFTKPKVLHSKQERSKCHDFINKQANQESLDACSSIETESVNPPPKLHFKVLNHILSNREQKNRNDTKERYKDSYDICNSVEVDISNLREHNSKLKSQDKPKRRHHNNYRHKKNPKDSEYDSSVESDGTNRHSFRTACSQYLTEDHDCIFTGLRNVERFLSNHDCENNIEPPFQSDNSHFRPAHYPKREQINYQSFQTIGGYEERKPIRFPQGKEHSQHLYGDNPYESYNQFEKYKHDNFQQQDFPYLCGNGSSHMISGTNLHEEWYSNWYIRVRQRAMQLGMMEYTKSMSTL